MKTYEELRKINVNEHIEKKNNLSYLSWAWAVDVLFQNDPDASWAYSLFDGKPYMAIGDTFMVWCSVRAFGRERTAQLPIMNYKNQPLKEFTSFDLNTTMQRCLAKAISLHGIGLYIYAGEDLPEGAEPATDDEKKPKEDSPGKIVDQALAMEELSPEVRDAVRKEAKKIEGDFWTIGAKAAHASWMSFEASADEAQVRFCWSLIDTKVKTGINKFKTVKPRYPVNDTVEEFI